MPFNCESNPSPTSSDEACWSSGTSSITSSSSASSTAYATSSSESTRSSWSSNVYTPTSPPAELSDPLPPVASPTTSSSYSPLTNTFDHSHAVSQQMHDHVITRTPGARRNAISHARPDTPAPLPPYPTSPLIPAARFPAHSSPPTSPSLFSLSPASSSASSWPCRLPSPPTCSVEEPVSQARAEEAARHVFWRARTYEQSANLSEYELACFRVITERQVRRYERSVAQQGRDTGLWELIYRCLEGDYALSLQETRLLCRFECRGCCDGEVECSGLECDGGDGWAERDGNGVMQELSPVWEE